MSATTTEPPWLRIEAACHPPAATLRCRGEIDLSTAPLLEQALTAWVVTGVSELDVDLREVTFVDSCAIGPLLSADRRLRRDRGSLKVRTSRRGARLFHLLGMDRVLEVDAA